VCVCLYVFFESMCLCGCCNGCGMIIFACLRTSAGVSHWGWGCGCVKSLSRVQANEASIAQEINKCDGTASIDLTAGSKSGPTKHQAQTTRLHTQSSAHPPAHQPITNQPPAHPHIRPTTNHQHNACTQTTNHPPAHHERHTHKPACWRPT
jgi:hypothetical protein